MSTLEQLMDGPILAIYSTPLASSTTAATTTTTTTTLASSSQQSSSSQQQQSRKPYNHLPITTAMAAPGGGGAGQRKAAPSQKELVELYNSIAGRWVAESYEMLDSSIQNETYSPEGTWGLTVTSQSTSASRRVETAATLQLNRAKQQEAPVGWEVNTTFATNSGHFIGNIDQDGISVRCFAGFGPVGYQGSQSMSFAGDQDSTVHSFSYQPGQSLAVGYKYQNFPQVTVQSFSAATKVDTLGLGMETTFAQGNISVTGKVAKKWYLFPTPDVRRGDDATADMQQAQRLMSKSQILTAGTISNTGEFGFGIVSKVGWKFLRDWAISTKISLAQGKFDLRGMMSFFILGRRLKFSFDQDAALGLAGRCGVWGDSNLDLEGKVEFNPLQLYVAGQMPVLTAKLNWNIPVPQDNI